ncbi:hypothetical protein RCO28_20700 [Streptomyces sp. LHD-70]|uniref:hypothetical protein n=1 Tax=Streptomyces sp. LHD-70 TaxID=3072140 RepID=UPI00280D4BE5|nr:hypothetical protein [Streptomyces sp. LHD-70]MDQ8704893.1 hypothetical protein [Streptomyces sp. LHD-70]
MPTTEIDLINETVIQCSACGDIAPAQYDEDEVDYELGWHVLHIHCSCDLLCGDCFEDVRAACDAVIYDAA